MYVTRQQLEERYGARMLIGLTDRATPPAGAIDETVLDRAIADAGALIDGYVGTRYALPLAATPPVLRDAAAAIAVYKLYRDVVPEKQAADYRDALHLLRDLAAGTAVLDLDGEAPPGAPGGGSRADGAERVFTGHSLSGFVP